MTQAEAAKLQPGFNLTGRRAVVFAGNGQLGRAVTEALAEAGAQITVSGDGTGAAVRGPWNFEAADVAKAAEVDRVFDVAGRTRGGTDVAVFVADAYQAGPIAESKAAAVVTANLLGAYHVFRAAAVATTVATIATGISQARSGAKWVAAPAAMAPSTYTLQTAASRRRP